MIIDNTSLLFAAYEKAMRDAKKNQPGSKQSRKAWKLVRQLKSMIRDCRDSKRQAA